ncbi:hypothetical protein G6F57_001911 [Rhizopus arrhizus]|jgi:hypothetical protein|uniref:C2H2-type domain-containing protein n=1 Tax=Rhizopus oryzae TaxID=64495 RepID=A0A9P6XF44_RHIOR|nr:hypothetical protein G6F23_004423 [Rhizopus arrhizus]KAG1394326.1 hypothetical protein G6F58_012145 [Rhizopus delemar]KAG0768109.1 hypothetical protein G6F24_002222 [Rhizopus arrhizus]KAG0785510.1 hypothetical protein G6F21_009211 [Rhizopus arrhizus]KAG0815315.1 hypothetical protein G6F20_004090 [Rhizopus arrhizus]
MSSLLTFQLRQQQNNHKSQENQSGIPSPPNSFCGEEQKVERRDSLQTVFNDMCIREYSASLPENYTIEHSSATHRKASHATTSTATAAATGGLTIRNNRRQSDAFKRKGRGLSESYNNGQYRCNDCGKSYKHPNCLQKHRWEHSEEWELTKKLPLTKHQQVQMLEAAAILIGMDRRAKSLSEYHHEEEEEEEEEIDVFRVDEEEDEEDEESIVIDDEEESKSLHSQEIFMDDI